MLRSVKVREYMVTRQEAVKPDTSIYEASQIIIDNALTGVVVVDDDGNLVGMLSELDCLEAIVDGVYNDGDPGGARVADFMTPEVKTNSPDDFIIDVAQAMLANKHRRRPIVDNGKLVGQLTCRQILRAIRDFTKGPARALKK